MREFSFPPEYRLRRRQDFFRVNQMGRKKHTPHFLVFSLHEKNSVTRLGVTVSRKVGNAVCRNHTKRMIREFFRKHYRMIEAGFAISIIAKQGASRLAYQDVAEELSVLLKLTR